jgi:hypothetical protein
MHALTTKLLNDEAGFIVSAELVLVSTIAVLGLVVGLSEVAWNVNEELEDVGSAFASVNQGFSAKGAHGHKGCTTGFSFHDCPDFCAGPNDLTCGY